MKTMSLPLQTNIEQKTDLFLSLAKIKHKQPEVKLKILEHVNADSSLHNYVLFRHSSLYFFYDDNVEFIEKTKDDYTDRYYLRFDGEKVSRIDPEYYLGALNKHCRDNKDASAEAEYEISYRSNNNNNNNNNGNNNNG